MPVLYYTCYWSYLLSVLLTLGFLKKLLMNFNEIYTREIGLKKETSDRLFGADAGLKLHVAVFLR